MKKIFTFSFLFCFFLSSVLFGQYTDTTTFEMPTSRIKIDTNAGNIWQIGKPQKNLFSNAHSGNKAILTDTVNPYPINNSSVFTFYCPPIQSCLDCISFWQKYDTDTLKDKGIIEASYDGGSSWWVVKDTSNFNYSFTWNSDYQHSNNVSGNSNGWINSEFCWIWVFIVKTTDTIISPPDSLMLRFTFTSDSINDNREGWIVDDITWIDYGVCSGAKEDNENNEFSIYPNPSYKEISIDLKNSFLKDKEISIYNLLSEKIFLHRIVPSENIISLNIEALRSGIYFIEISDMQGKTFRKKFVKE